MQAQGNTIDFMLGGVRSGKSRYAQRLAKAERRDDEEVADALLLMVARLPLLLKDGR